MQVISQEFRSNLLAQLNSLPAGSYLTRKQLCQNARVDEEWSLAVSVLVEKDPEFAVFEGVKSKGYRKRKDLPSQ